MVDRRVVEFLHIAVSVLVVSAAFAYGSESFVSDFFLIVVAVGTGFVLHELAHRFVAISYGAKASYHAWGFGLAMAVVLALVTGGAFVFAAPGAVVIYGAHRLSTEKYGKVALSGPLTNFVVALLFIFIALFFPLFGNLAFFAARVNAFLGAFNLLPFFPLDGQKVMAWNKALWIVSFAALALLMLLIPSSVSI